jgi:hypothetical protein
MTNFALTDPLDFRTITNLYLYGQSTTPQSYDQRIRPAGAPTVDVNVDPSFWNATGPGRFAMPAINSFVKSFFESPASIFSSPGVLQIFANHLAAQGGVGPVSISVAELKTVLPFNMFLYFPL